MGAQLFACLDRLVESVFMAKKSTPTSKDKKGCSIEEVMEELYSIDEVNFGDALYTFATYFFLCEKQKGDVGCDRVY